MFNSRTTVLVILVGLMATAIIARLVDIQVLDAEKYERLAEKMVTRPERYFPAPRGTICDRNGTPLLRDEAAFDISIHYAVLTFSNREKYLYWIARQLQRKGYFPKSMSRKEIVSQFQTDIATMWRDLADVTHTSPEEFLAVAEKTRKRTERIREIVEKNNGHSVTITEEISFHPVIKAVDSALAVEIKERFPQHRYPWLSVIPSSRRVSHDADTFCHILGQMGQVSKEHLETDPFKDDDLRCLNAGGLCGVSGIEKLAELKLRGTRGMKATDADDNVIMEISAQPGSDVFLTIDAELQKKCYEILGKAVDALPQPSGGAAVVIDADTREVLAMVSYPGYHFDTFREDYVQLRQETKRKPLKNRAIQTAYAPGSTCKAITIVGALSDGKTTEHEKIECTGHLLPNDTTKLRCWIYNEYKRTHGPLTAEEAIMKSCNIFLFKVGGRLGTERLCEWFRKFGLGKHANTGLLGETGGIVPDDAWVARNSRKNRQEGDVWNYAIGQGEVTATPLQVANVAASIATGRWEPIKFLANKDGDWLNPRDGQVEVFNENAIRVLRRGMYRVVNDRYGTAKKAKLNTPGYVLCGKTGSAQTQPHIVNYTFEVKWSDGREQSIVAPTKVDALAMINDPDFEPPPFKNGQNPVIVTDEDGNPVKPTPSIGRWWAHERYPSVLPGEKTPANAWFMGYTQLKSTPVGAEPRGRCYAIGVLVEFGESGGGAAGPVARDIADWLLEHDNE